MSNKHIAVDDASVTVEMLQATACAHELDLISQESELICWADPATSDHLKLELIALLKQHNVNVVYAGNFL